MLLVPRALQVAPTLVAPRWLSFHSLSLLPHVWDQTKLNWTADSKHCLNRWTPTAQQLSWWGNWEGYHSARPMSRRCSNVWSVKNCVHICGMWIWKLKWDIARWCTACSAATPCMGQLRIHTRREEKLGEAVEERLTFTFFKIKTLDLSLKWFV